MGAGRGSGDPSERGRAWGQLELAHILHCFIGWVGGELSAVGPELGPRGPWQLCLRGPPTRSRPGGGGGGDGAVAPSELPPLGLCFSGVCTAHFFFGVLSAVRDTGEGWAGRPGPTCVEREQSVGGGPVSTLDLLPTACGHAEKPVQAEAGGQGHHLHLFPDLRDPTFQKGLLYRPEVILWSLVAGDLGQTLGMGSWGLPHLSMAPPPALWAPCWPTHVVAPRGTCCSPPGQPWPRGQSCLLASPAPCLALFAPGAVRATQPPSCLRWCQLTPDPGSGRGFPCLPP